MNAIERLERLIDGREIDDQWTWFATRVRDLVQGDFSAAETASVVGAIEALPDLLKAARAARQVAEAWGVYVESGEDEDYAGFVAAIGALNASHAPLFREEGQT